MGRDILTVNKFGSSLKSLEPKMLEFLEEWWSKAREEHETTSIAEDAALEYVDGLIEHMGL
jgi:hypothetical protein